MKSSHFVPLVALGLVAFAGGMPQTAHADGVRAALEAANAQFSAAAAKGDGASLAALYAPDGQLMPVGSEVIRGTAAIQKFWQAALDSGVAGVALKTVEVFNAGSTATEVGEYELHDKAGMVLDRGKYIVVWRRDGAKWNLLRDMFSTNAPAPKM